ncbi:MAG: hypothetical protein WCB93_06280 [Gallionella sp.]
MKQISISLKAEFYRVAGCLSGILTIFYQQFFTSNFLPAIFCHQIIAGQPSVPMAADGRYADWHAFKRIA